MEQQHPTSLLAQATGYATAVGHAFDWANHPSMRYRIEPHIPLLPGDTYGDAVARTLAMEVSRLSDELREARAEIERRKSHND